MIGQSCGNGRSSLHPTMAERTDRQFQPQAMVKVAEVIEAANQVHACEQGLSLLGQIAGATRQRADPLAKGGVEAFDESGIDDAYSLCLLD